MLKCDHTGINFNIKQYGKNRRRCQQNKFYYAVWQLLLYFYREFPSKILSVHKNHGFLHLPEKMREISENFLNKSCRSRQNTHFMLHLLFSWG